MKGILYLFFALSVSATTAATACTCAAATAGTFCGSRAAQEEAEEEEEYLRGDCNRLALYKCEAADALATEVATCPGMCVESSVPGFDLCPS
jgi:hypothetical protein